MKQTLKIQFKRKAPSSLLGLAIDGSSLEGVVLRRSNGSLIVNQRFNARLSLDPLTNEAELVGREILNHLEAAGIRERTCVVVVPLNWTLAAHTVIPKLPDSDIPGFLQIEAERGFPTDVATLQMAISRLVSASGDQHATLVGVPTNQVGRLDRALRAARLKPISFSLGITALQPASGTGGILALAIGESQVGLQICCGGGVAALRALEGAVETEGGRRSINAAHVAREARITLGQLPADLREMVKRIRIFGPRDQAQLLANEIRPRFEPAGLQVEVISTYPADAFGKTIPADTAVSRAFSLAARHLIGRDDPFEFLPPKVSRLQQFGAKYASGPWRTAGLAAAGVLLLCSTLFGYQQWQLSSLKSRWSSLSPKVRELTTVQDNIIKYRGWYDDSFRYLGIMKRVTLAFPEDGSVTAKTFEIRELTDPRDPEAVRDTWVVTCSGNAANYTAWIKTVHQVGSINGISDLSQQTRGKSPMQFTIDFHLKGGGNEN